MQALVPASSTRNPNGHTAAEILAALRGQAGSRQLRFRYELLTSANIKLLDLDDVTACTVAQNWLADIKRTATFAIKDTGLIDFLSNRIKPYVRLLLPPYGASDWVEWPQGVFLLSSPVRHIDQAALVTRQIDGFDPLQVFADDMVATRYTVLAGANYVSTVSILLGSISKSVQASSSVLPAAKEWEPGTSKLKIINELLGAINYNSLAFDEDGVALVSSYTAPSARAEEYVYADDDNGLIVPEVDQQLDLFSVANTWTLVVSNPDQSVITSSYTNDDPSSPTSTVSRQRTITDFRTAQDAADQATLDAQVARLAFEASQVYEGIDFQTALMPIHSGNDVYRLTYSGLAINDRYSEQSWSMELKAGAPMKHHARRVVSV